MIYLEYRPDITIRDFLLNEQMLDYFTFKGYFGNPLKFYIYKNPTEKEWDDVVRFARGWISPQGDLYIQGGKDSDFSSAYDAIHYDILMALSNKGIHGITPAYIQNYFKPSGMGFRYEILKYGLLIQRQEVGRTIMFSESMHRKGAIQNGFPHVEAEATKLYSVMKARNPFLSYINCIMWTTGSERLAKS